MVEKIIVCVLGLLASCHANDWFCHKIITGASSWDSYFGYSVQLRSGRGRAGRVLVGAPRANSSHAGHRHIFQPGAVYSCDLASGCRQYVFDPEGNTRHTMPNWMSYEHHKDNGWLGASLDGPDQYAQPLVACAPRWINSFFVQANSWFQQGMCYRLRDASEPDAPAELLMPLQNSSFMYTTRASKNEFNYAFGEAGMSVLYDGRVAIGAPGVLNWRGAVAEYETPFNARSLGMLQVPQVDEGSYFGYSIASGRFLRGSASRWYVVGAPRDAQLRGRVFVLEASRLRYNATGLQFGEYFGAALAVADVNGDGVDDVIVGAPMHSRHDQEDLDAGCVYQLVSDGRGGFKVDRVQTVPEAVGRLGTALAAIGDVDGDQYVDVAVGLPECDGGRGAVLVCLGSREGLGPADRQRLVYAADLHPNLNGFGVSISRGLDVDNNNVTDIAVGAYRSGHVVVLLGRPEISVKTALRSQLNHFTINTDRIKVAACLLYDGLHARNTLRFHYNVNFTDDRFTFIDSGHDDAQLNKWEQAALVTKGHEHCLDLLIKFQPKYHGLNPLIITMDFDISSESDAECDVRSPVLAWRPAPASLLLSFRQGCANEEACRPSLSLALSTRMYESTQLELRVDIANSGDPAYNCMLYVNAPRYVSLRKLPDGWQLRDHARSQNNTFRLEMLKSLTQDKQESIQLVFDLDVEQIDYEEPFTAYLNISSSGTEDDKSDNEVNLSQVLEHEEKLVVTSLSTPKKVKETEKEASVMHQIYVKSSGHVPLDLLDMTLYLPARLQQQDFISVQSVQVALSSTWNDAQVTTDISEHCSVERRQPQRPVAQLEDAAAHSVSCNRTDVSCASVECSWNKVVRIRRADIVMANITMRVRLTVLDKWTSWWHFSGSHDEYTLATEVRVRSHSGRDSVHHVTTSLDRSTGSILWIVVGVLVGVAVIAVIGLILWKFGCLKQRRFDPTVQGRIVRRSPERSSA